MRKIITLILLGIMTISLSACQKTNTIVATISDTKAVVNLMKGEYLDTILEDNRKKEDFLVIDVRSEKEYNEGHVKHAININVETIEQNLTLLESYKNKNVVTICNTGNRSQKAAETLTKNGFQKVYSATGVKEFEYKNVSKVKNIIGSELAKLANEGKVTIVDTRDNLDYKAGHLKNAVSIPAAEVDEKMNTISKEKTVVFYCYTGNKSLASAEKFAKAGYTVISSIDGTKEVEYDLVK